MNLMETCVNSQSDIFFFFHSVVAALTTEPFIPGYHPPFGGQLPLGTLAAAAATINNHQSASVKGRRTSSTSSTSSSGTLKTAASPPLDKDNNAQGTDTAPCMMPLVGIPHGNSRNLTEAGKPKLCSAGSLLCRE